MFRKVGKSFNRAFAKIENNNIFRAIRKGLIRAIPILMVGSVALLVLNFPITAYQDFLSNFLGGALRNIFLAVHGGTLGIVSLYFLVTISYSYAELKVDKLGSLLTVPIVALGSYGILCDVGAETFSVSANFGVLGMFTAILTAIIASTLFIKLCSFSFFNAKKIYADGTDHDFNSMVSLIIPAGIVFLIFAIFNFLLTNILHVQSITDLLSQLLVGIFANMDSGLLAGVLYVFFVGMFWFFGIHGGNVLDVVGQQLFATVAASAIATSPSDVMSKTFIDVFAFMGGSGATICLVAAIMLFSKRRNTRNLAKLGGAPVLLNINEFLLFGMPIVLNPIMFVPFVITPVVHTIISYIAMATGLVPVVTNTVLWTVPIFFSGYTATGSLAGVLLQLFNLIVGIFIYRPFIKMYERNQLSALKRDIGELFDILMKLEEERQPSDLLERRDHLGAVAKTLATDLKYAIQNERLQLFYQPQVDDKGFCFGVEALLRWEHEIGGFIPPPLIVALAREADLLADLENQVLQICCREGKLLCNTFGDDFAISVNITADFLRDPQFLVKLQTAVQQNSFPPSALFIEVTEQTALSDTPEISEKLEAIHTFGHALVIDDFGMGHTSLMYLQNNQFDMVKLDGSLVRSLSDNERSADIISSIVFLSGSLGFDVLAEFVETEELEVKLLELGVSKFQGYLYSRPEPLEKVTGMLKKCREEKLKTQEVNLLDDSSFQ